MKEREDIFDINNLHKLIEEIYINSKLNLLDTYLKNMSISNNKIFF